METKKIGYVKMQWEIRCPDCGELIHYEGPQISLDPGTIGATKRLTRIIQCPKCMIVHCELLLYTWLDSKKNFGIILDEILED